MSPRPIEFPVEGLSDGVVRLRLMGDADLGELTVALQDPQIPRYTTIPQPYGEQEARQWQRMAGTGLAAGTDLPTLIVDADGGGLLGGVGLHGIDPATARCAAGY
ncbi:MAG: GNAT family N-acetyltransferase, partial [Solirubrobacterales bacterium]